ncbi:MAG: glycosyltransferase family A protein [Hyphomicrobiales bacterium]
MAATDLSDSLVAAFHRSRITVVVPHHNLSEFLADALISVQQQSHRNFSCILVDDASEKEHASHARNVIEGLDDPRFRFVQAPANRGMVHAIYRGIDEAPAAFTCVLDPDDRYAPEFLERMLAVHLNRVAFAALACCDQYLLQIGDGVITGTERTNGLETFATGADAAEQECFRSCGFHRFVTPLEAGWHWSSTSSMMFRTEALRLIRPGKELAYKGQGDDYCANGAHMLGGSLLLREPLVYRGLHDRNDFISRHVMSMWQRRQRDGAVPMSAIAKIDVVEAFFDNDGLRYFDPLNIREVLLAQFDGDELERLKAAVPAARALLSN